MVSKIFVVIPFYNGREYIPDCFDSLEKQALSPTKIIVVDNNSTDGSQKDLIKIQQRNSRVQIIYNSTNRGFVGACNQGMEEAINQGADYIFLLNQDTICDPDCLKNLFNLKIVQKNVFAIQALLLCWPQKDLIQTSGDHIHFLGFGYSGDFKKSASLYTDLEIKGITYASGAAVLLDTEILREIGLFDQDLFMYHDDLDLSWRARLLGYKILLAPRAIVYHKYTEGVVKHRWYWSERNRHLTLLKFYKWPTLLLILPPWLIMELGVLLYSIWTGWVHLKIKSYFSALRLLSKTIQKRKHWQKIRIISDRKIAKWLDGQFNFAGLNNRILKNIINPVFGLYWWFVRNIIFW